MKSVRTTVGFWNWWRIDGPLGTHQTCTQRKPDADNTLKYLLLDNRFHLLATSQKVCDACRKQSGVPGIWPFVSLWSRPEIERVWGRKTWRTGSTVISLSWRALKAASDGSTLSSLSYCPGRLASTYRRFWRSSKPPRSPTIKFENNAVLGRSALCVPM